MKDDMNMFVRIGRIYRHNGTDQYVIVTAIAYEASCLNPENIQKPEPTDSDQARAAMQKLSDMSNGLVICTDMQNGTYAYTRREFLNSFHLIDLQTLQEPARPGRPKTRP